MSRESLIKYWKNSGLITDKRLLDAFMQVPREKFVHKYQSDGAYSDNAMPVSHGQTISQPTTVMIMIQALELKKSDNVLEIGAGTGYNAALMSKLAGKVIAIEIIPELAEFAKKNLDKVGIKNVKVINEDGSTGYLEEALFDKIIITAACPKIPKPLIDQLCEKGIIVAPVGNRVSQKMIKGIKVNNELKINDLGDFVFVPLKGKYGF